MTFKEIEARLAAIRQECQADGADLDALTAETEKLQEERAALTAQAEKRSRLLAGIAATPGIPAVEAPKSETRNFEIMTKEAVIATPEYRNAFCKYLQARGSKRGADMTDLERRAWTTATASGGAAVPTELSDKIWEKVYQTAPLLQEITLYHVPGELTIAVEDDTADPAEHTEGAALTAAADTLTSVTLGQYEVCKLTKASKSIAKMSIPAFMSFLVTSLSAGLARFLVKRIISGSGSSQATGVDKANTWGAGNSVTVAKAATLTTANVLELISLLPGGYDANGKFLMSKKTLFQDFMPLQDKSKNDLVMWQNGTYYIYGYPVMLDDNVTVHEAYLGDFSKYVANMAEEINVTGDFEIKENSFYFLGACMFDGKPAVADAFRKLVKGTT